MTVKEAREKARDCQIIADEITDELETAFETIKELEDQVSAQEDTINDLRDELEEKDSQIEELQELLRQYTDKSLEVESKSTKNNNIEYDSY